MDAQHGKVNLHKPVWTVCDNEKLLPSTLESLQEYRQLVIGQQIAVYTQ